MKECFKKLKKLSNWLEKFKPISSNRNRVMTVIRKLRYAIKLMKFRLILMLMIRVRVPLRPEFFRPFFRYCLSSIAKLRRSLEDHSVKTGTRRIISLELLGSFSIDDEDGNDNATNKQFNWSSEENKRAARVARNYEQVRAILCKTTT